MDDLIGRLQMGSADQGRKFLRNIGAIKMAYISGSRRVDYEAVAESRNRNAPDRSKTRVPPATSCGATFAEISSGSARKTASVSAIRRSTSNGSTGASQIRFNAGIRRGSDPAEAMARRTSAYGCRASLRMSSTPEYPVTPATPTLIEEYLFIQTTSYTTIERWYQVFSYLCVESWFECCIIGTGSEYL